MSDTHKSRLKREIILFWLNIKVFIVHRLVKLKVLPNVWYSCEIKRAKLEAKKIKQWMEANWKI